MSVTFDVRLPNLHVSHVQHFCLAISICVQANKMPNYTLMEALEEGNAKASVSDIRATGKMQIIHPPITIIIKST